MALIELSNLDLINLDLALDLAIKASKDLTKINPEYYKLEIETFSNLKIKLRTNEK